MMGPVALGVFANASADLRETIARSQHFLINRGILDVAQEVAVALAKSDGDIFDFLMPSDVVIIEFAPTTGRALLVSDAGQKVHVHVLSNRSVQHLGSFVRHSRTWQASRTYEDHGLAQDALKTGLMLDALFSLIAEPRIVQKVSPSRQQRRAAQRAFNGEAGGGEWSELRWTVGETVIPTSGSTDESNRMPLHFCRAHWVHMPDGKKGQTTCPICGRQRSWRSHSWKGHPRFGTKLIIRNPDVDEDGDSAEIISALKRQATDAAKKTAIREWEKQQSIRRRKKK